MSEPSDTVDGESQLQVEVESSSAFHQSIDLLNVSN